MHARLIIRSKQLKTFLFLWAVYFLFHTASSKTCEWLFFLWTNNFILNSICKQLEVSICNVQLVPFYQTINGTIGRITTHWSEKWSYPIGIQIKVIILEYNSSTKALWTRHIKHVSYNATFDEWTAGKKLSAFVFSFCTRSDIQAVYVIQHKREICLRENTVTHFCFCFFGRFLCLVVRYL